MKYRFLRLKYLLLYAAAAGLVLAGILFGADAEVGRYAELVHCRAENVPLRKAGLLLGTAPRTRGRPNLYFLYRIDAAAELHRVGRIEKIIVSGDNSRADYNEPEEMRLALIGRGVPADDIVADCAGFRTLDSVVRAKTIFRQTELVVISQRFHCERAIYIARHHGIDAVGFAAREVPARIHLKTAVRELFARFMAVLDVKLLGRTPHFAGAPIPLDPP